MSRRPLALGPAAVALIGIVGWIGLAWLGATLYATHPPSAGFDLEVLLRAGRSVAAGGSPYDQAILGGTAPVAERLFYSYPPPVAQVLSLVAGWPSGLLLVVWDLAAVAALAVVGRWIALRILPGRTPARTALIVVALVPLLFPFAIGLLFGNLDVFFPGAYGLMVLAVIVEGPAARSDGNPGTARAGVLGGLGLAVGGLTKVHPALLGGWFIVRALRSPALWWTVAGAVGFGLAIVAVSLLVGGSQPWLDYGHLLLVRAGSGADLVDPRNAGPAAQLALALAGTGSGAEALARSIQTPIAIGAVAITLLVAWRVGDPLESLAWATVASLVVLPVTWYHYPSALIPFGLVAILRADAAPSARRAIQLVAVAAVVGALAIAWLPLIWLAVALVLLAIRASRPFTAGPP